MNKADFRETSCENTGGRGSPFFAVFRISDTKKEGLFYDNSQIWKNNLRIKYEKYTSWQKKAIDFFAN